MAQEKPLILLIEDHPDIVEIVEYNLRKEGFEFAKATDGQEGLRKIQELKPSLVLLDIMLPKIDGMEVCRRVRAQKETKDIPIIMLTAKGSGADIVQGLELGADDYVTKPFGPRVLVARIRSVLRRLEPHSEVLRFEQLVVDRHRYEVRISNEVVFLTRTEFRLLATLLKNKDRVLTRHQIINKVAGDSVVIVDRNVDVHIASLRKKIKGYGKHILTVRGVGYRFVE